MGDLPPRLWPTGARRTLDDTVHGPARSSASTTLTRGEPEEAALGSLRVMVVDDNDGFRESLIDLLGSAGLRVVGEASSGTEALVQVAELDPDIVLMDIRMPGMDGVETTRRLKSAHPSVRVMALTAQEDEQVVREMLVAGASGYVLKNSEGDDILSAVSEAAGGGAVLSPAVTPTVIDQLTHALDRERQRSKELEEAHLTLIERVARRNELVSRLGHELRTPVTVILGLAKTLGSPGIELSERDDLLSRLETRARALARLVERFETALDATSGDAIDVPALARDIASASGESRVVTHAEEAVPAAWGNPMLARRVLEETMDNACRFSDGDVEVRITTGAGVIEVRVLDHGPGVKLEDRERIFEPLEQGEALDSRMHEGAGVGLSVGRAAARAMDGDLVLETTGPEGSTFLWTLPMAAAR